MAPLCVSKVKLKQLIRYYNMTCNYEIDLMHPYDIADVLELERKAFGNMAWHSNDFESAISSSYDFPFVIHKRPLPDKESMDAYIDNVAGYGILRLLGPEAEIENICVSDSIRRKGIGKALMQHMINVAQKNNASTIYLEVRAANDPAKSLYTKMGFESSYIRKGYYRDPLDDAIIMSLNLTQ